MVRIEGKSDYDRLDDLVREIAAKHDLQLNIAGWTRKTYEVFRPKREDKNEISVLARIESFATTNGEITIFHDDAMPFAEDMGGALEREFDIKEAVIVQRPPG